MESRHLDKLVEICAVDTKTVYDHSAKSMFTLNPIRIQITRSWTSQFRADLKCNP